MTVETYTLTGEYTSGGDPGRGFVELTPSQTVVDAPGDTIAAGVKIHIPLVDGAFTKTLLPTGIGYHARPVLYDGYPPEADFTVAPGTVTLDMADVTDDYLVPLDPTGLEQAEAYTDARVGLSATTQVELEANLTALATTGGTILLPESLTLTSGVTIPQGVTVRGMGSKRSVVSYAGTGVAFTLTGSSTNDSRIGGGLQNVAVKMSAAGTAVELLDCREMNVDVAVLGGNGTSTKAAAVGISLRYGTTNVGCSWNRVHAYVEYCLVGWKLDGSAHSPAWVTRNTLTGHVQGCTTGLLLTGAGTNHIFVDPQNCTTAYDLTDSDDNDIHAVCESNTTDFTADATSTNNLLEGVFPTIGAAGTGTIWRFARQTALSPVLSPLQLDGAGGVMNVYPKTGETGNVQLWSRNNAGTLVRAMYAEGGVASPRVRFPVQVKFDAGADFTGQTLTGLGIVVAARTSSSFLLTQSSTAFADVTGLGIPVAASTVYEIEAFIAYDASIVSDLKFSWTAPAGASMLWTADGLQVAATTATDTTTRSRIGSVSGSMAIGGAGVGTVVTCRLFGTLVVSTTAGTLQLQAAQNTSEATQVTIYALSRLRGLVLS